MKRTAVESCTQSSVLKLDLSTENNDHMKSIKHVTIGFTATEAIKKSDITEANLMEFKSQCKNFYRSVAQKIIQRSPLQFPVVRNLECLNPNNMSKISNSK